MESNTHSTQEPLPESDWLAALAVVADGLAGQDLERLADSVRAERVLRLRRLLDRLEGHWLKELAGVDARGAAGTEDGLGLGSPAAGLRRRLRRGAVPAAKAVPPAGAFSRAPLTA